MEELKYKCPNCGELVPHSKVYSDAALDWREMEIQRARKETAQIIYKQFKLHNGDIYISKGDWEYIFGIEG